MDVLVVGGAGYIGSHTARALQRRGHGVIIYDNISTGHAFLADGFELIVGDISDTRKLSAVLKRVQGVMHFAAHAYVGESVEQPRKYFHNNVEAGLSLLNTALDKNLRTLVFSSSAAVYGEPATTPLTEDMPRQPVNPYGITKLFFENALEAYDRAYGFRSARLRYFNAAGADESGEIGEWHDPESHLIPLALAAAARTGPALNIFGTDYPTPDGTCIRDYIHVNDLAEAHVLALEYLERRGTSLTVNLGTGEGNSVKEVISMAEEVTGSQVPVRSAARRPGDPPVLVADASRARQLLGWKPTRGLREMVATAWNWMQRARQSNRLAARTPE